MTGWPSVVNRKDVRRKSFSCKLERGYYGRQWPKEAKPYLHLDPYLRCWLNPEAVFEGKRVLDIGAGECTYTRLIADRFRPKQIVACELFRERLVPAVRANPNPILKFVVGDSFRLPFRSKSFDVVFGSLVLSQFPTLGGVISEIRRVLAIGGSYIGIEPNPYNLVHLYRYFFGSHSPNQYLFRPKNISLFALHEFKVTSQYFYAKFPRIRWRFFGTCIGINAKLLN